MGATEQNTKKRHLYFQSHSFLEVLHYLKEKSDCERSLTESTQSMKSMWGLIQIIYQEF
jgi:hypothetical protein